MWSWDQGRLDYFQFDNLKKIARFAVTHDLRTTDRITLAGLTNLPFLPIDERYKPWRNYSRVFKLSMICAEKGDKSAATPLSKLLASDGGITTDEYYHFLVQATTDPSPALQDWDNGVVRRYPLLFALKYLLTCAAIGEDRIQISEIIAAYQVSGFKGEEDQTAFVALVSNKNDVSTSDRKLASYRQAAESIQVIAQISYLSLEKRCVTVSLSKDDALHLFEQLTPIGGEALENGADEVFRLTSMFAEVVSDLELDYEATVISDVEDSGFSSMITYAEGAKTRKTHLIIERNSKIRREYFKAYPSSVCDFCNSDTSITYPWTPRILDIHHLLPLCSGARTSKKGTLLDDLVAVCPTCHRGIHRFYDIWLKEAGKKDFLDSEEAKKVYEEAKSKLKLAQNVNE